MDTFGYNKSFIRLTQSKENTYQPVVFFISFANFFENRLDIGICERSGKKWNLIKIEFLKL